MTSAVDTRSASAKTIPIPDVPAPAPRPSHTRPHRSDVDSAVSAAEPFAVRSVGFLRTFAEHIVAANASMRPDNGQSSRHVIDWDAVEASVADAQTLEQAIGRAVVIVDQMSRALFVRSEQLSDPWPPPSADDPFFAFSMVDVVPDFGDESRYRKRVANTMAKIFGATARQPLSPASR
jgi:hypothetical protein